MKTVYNIIFTIWLVITAPYSFMRLRRRGNWRQRLRQRCGHYDTLFKQSITNRDTLWIHAVGISEVHLCTRLIHGFERRLPNLKLIVSSSTSRGMGELKRRLPSHISRIIYPLDRRVCVARSQSCVRPQAVVLVGNEIRPNFLWRARQMGLPCFLIYPDVSERACARFHRWRRLYSPLFASFTGVAVQTEAEAARLRDLGAQPEAIRVFGKLDMPPVELEELRIPDAQGTLDRLGVRTGAPLVVAVNTSEDEEALLTKQLPHWLEQFPELFLVLAPRELGRSREVARRLKERGVKFMCRNEVSVTTNRVPGELNCLLINTPGHLRYYYEHASVIFFSRRLAAHDGLDALEPAALGKALVFGPHMENATDAFRDLLAHGGAVQARDTANLAEMILNLLADEPRRRELGLNALEIVGRNKHAIDHLIAMITRHFKSEELCLAATRVERDPEPELSSPDVS